MLKVLIADDEKKVCQLILNLVDWEKLGFEVVGVMNDGIAAYNYIQKNTVDVLITDIRMPGCDGMELIRKVKVLYPQMFVAIISGYGQFDYAQTAIKYGVSDYLLKPIRKKDMLSMLQKISGQCEEKASSKQKIEKLERKLEENQARMKQGFLEDIMKYPEKFGGYYVRERINSEYQCSFDEESFQAMIVKIIMDRNKENIDTQRVYLQKGKEILKKELCNTCNEMLINLVNDEICGLFNGDEAALDGVKRKLKKAKLELSQLQDIQVYIALGGRKHSLSLIEESFREARAAIQDRFYFGDRFWLTTRTEMDLKDKLENYITNEFRKRFLGHLEILNLDGLKCEIDSVKHMLQNSQYMYGQTVLEVYKGLVALFYFGAQSYNIGVFEQYEELMSYSENCGKIEELFDFLREYMVRSLIQWMEERKFEEAKPIRMAKKYINDNYNQSLTLEMVSKEIGFNPTYFSTVFKKETGMNFSDYLKKIRVENAKEMLLNTEKLIEDISFEVGYADIKYFSRLFKKMMGVTPTEFRKLYK